jgi:hypothetical protein
MEALGPHGERTGIVEGLLRKMGSKRAFKIQKRASGFWKRASGFNASSWAGSAFLNPEASFRNPEARFWISEAGFLPSFLSELAPSELPRLERGGGGGASGNTGLNSSKACIKNPISQMHSLYESNVE